MRYIYLSLLVLILFNLGCSSHSNSSDISESQSNKKSGLIFEELSFQDQDLSGTVIKNKFTKTAEAKIEMLIPDDVEKIDYMGEEISATPMIVNMFCRIIATALFNSSAMQELTESGNVTAESGKNFLEGYSVTKSEIKFIDKEDKKLIAECSATGSEWKDIKFNTYREYKNSLFGMVIGKTLQEVEKEALENPQSKILEPD
jgi:hypothetical protein